MDPNAALKNIEAALAPVLDLDTIEENAVALRDWLGGGGFQPDWEKYPNATKWYRHVYLG